MDIELLQIRDFLIQYHPFDLLPTEVMDEIPGKLEIRYARRNTEILKPGVANRWLHIIRTGAVETRTSDGQLLAHLDAGEIFGVRSLNKEGAVENTSIATEDALIYLMPEDLYRQLCDAHPQFAFFFDPMGAKRLRGAMLVKQSEAHEEQAPFIVTPIADVMSSKAPITCTPEVSIREAATVMTNIRVSSLLVVDGEGNLKGIVTDRDLRKRVIVAGLSTDLPIREIMTENPITIEEDESISEAQLLMMQRNIHHIPVMDGERPIGMITNTDLIRKQPASAVQLVGTIRKASDIETMQEASNRIPNVLVNMTEHGVDSVLIGKMVTSVADAVHLRLLEMAEEKFGKAPVAFSWMVGGSQARMEQTAHSDQDNALLLADDYDPKEHGEYFENLAIFMRDALDSCGYYKCPGDVMASNLQWRQPLGRWKGYFNCWIDEPQPKALMLSSVFFDIRHVAGDISLFNELQAHLLEKAKVNRIFLAYMAANALSHSPPLGFFRNFVLSRDKEHKDTFDLKHSGVVPIVDLARVYALAAGSAEVETIERLEAAMEAGVLSQDGGVDLIDSMRFINQVRMRHQAGQIKHGRDADNYMPPEELSPFERSHLKDAFSVVKTMQSAMELRYQAGRLS
uniref:Uncharacterized protein n=1 Tax=Magnetococcus massalia (strain MO-1) TaxID=451514 RepID=A0A1S7LFI5_MAGMO|nr:Conserved protein of unknown function. Containing IMP dehydrogenase domain [Candidatus Magnetococcus massalia]